MYWYSTIAIELEEPISECEKVSVWARKVTRQAPKFTVKVSSDGKIWTEIGTKKCDSYRGTRYEFDGDGRDLKHIRITKPGGGRWWRFMGLDAVSAEGTS